MEYEGHVYHIFHGGVLVDKALIFTGVDSKCDLPAGDVSEPGDGGCDGGCDGG